MSFFFNDTATTEIYTLSLHDALPIWWMLGTFLAWTGGIVSAARAARGDTSLVRAATPALVGAVALVAVARLARLDLVLPAEAGAGFTIALAALAVVALARKR